MAYDEKIAARILRIVEDWTGLTSKKMFGGSCLLLNERMFCGVYKDNLILRLGEKGAAEALRSPFVRLMDITGRPMKGWVMVRPEGFEDDDLLVEWLEEARGFVETLPAK